MNAQEDQYGEERLKAKLLQYRTAPAQEILEAILEDVQHHTAGHPQSDDITMIVLKAL